MNKLFLTILLSLTVFSSAFADASASASQTIQLILAPAIEIMTNNLQIKTTNTGANQSFTVKSNNGFTISVSTLADNQKVQLALVDNKTDGKAAANSGNLPLSTTNKSLIANCNRSDEQTFAVNYKAKNNAAVIYTATQP